MIEVRLFAALREGRGKKIFLEPNSVVQADDVLHCCNMKEEDVSIFLINGFHAKLNAAVKDEDVVSIFPPVGGG